MCVPNWALNDPMPDDVLERHGEPDHDRQELKMTKDYGRPATADANRAIVRRRLEELDASDGPRETLTVEWRGAPRHLAVIQLPVGDLYYNPATHRIRAQRSHDAGKDALLEADPWSASSQEYLGRLLKALPVDPSRVDPDFEALAESLGEYGQTEPGLVTHDGVLVNGNTRRAAILEKFGPARSMRVAILPESCDWKDVAEVELSLQLRKEHRRDYSYINRLVAVQELVEQGTPLQTIASTFRTTVARCKQDQWVYSCIQLMIERSAVDGARLPLIAFEDQAEKLRELQRAYEKLHTSNPEKAELLLETRLAAIMLGFSKTDVRFIEPGFEDRYLASAMAGEVLADTVADGGVSIPGLGRAVRGPSDPLRKAKALTDAILRSRAVSEYAGALSQGPSIQGNARIGRLKDAMKSAITEANKDSLVKKKKQAAPMRLTDASRLIDQCVTDLVMSRASRSLQEEAFEDAVKALRQSLEALALEARRTVKDPDEGVVWLIERLGRGL